MNIDDENKIYYIKVRCRNIKTKQIFYKKIYLKAIDIESILSYFNANLKNHHFDDDIKQLLYTGNNVIEAICDIDFSNSNDYIILKK